MENLNDSQNDHQDDIDQELREEFQRMRAERNQVQEQGQRNANQLQENQHKFVSVKRGAIYRTNTVRQQNTIIKYHFGTMNPSEEERRNPVHSITEIAKQFKMPQATVYVIVDRFLKRGNKVINNKHNCGPKRKPIYAALLHYLCNKKALEEQAHLSATARIKYIEEKTGYKFNNRYEIYNLYKRLNIKYCMPQASYKAEMQNDDARKQQRKEFARKLSKILLNDEQHVIYMDETTFRTWYTMRKTWMPYSQSIRYKQTNHSIGSCTLFGAISTGLKRPVFHIGLATNIDEFKKFINCLVPEIKPGLINKPYLLLDNHSAHTNKEVKEFLKQSFELLYLPGYSCRFNSIESLWGQLKHKYRESMPAHLDELERAEQHREIVLGIVQSLQTNEINAFITANQKYLIQILKS